MPQFDVMLTFSAGTAVDSVQPATISITDDSIVEGEERFRVELEESDPGLGDSSNFVINPTASTTDVIIVDNDGKLYLQCNPDNLNLLITKVAYIPY